MELQTPVEQLPKIGTALTKALHRLGIATVEDLLFHFPHRYLDFRKTSLINEVVEGEVVTIRGTLKTIAARRSFRSRLNLCEGIISDTSGSIKVMWFNQAYLSKTLKPGDELLLSGTVDRYKTLQLVNPVYEKIGDDNIHTGRLVPVYRGAEIISNRTLRNLIHQALPLAEQLTDELSPEIQKQLSLISLAEAVKTLHFPEAMVQVNAARFRVAVDDILPQQLAVQLQQRAENSQDTFFIEPDVEYIKAFLGSLPFTLTDSQKRATWDILQSLSQSHSMNRLLLGDVGSGKTIVALLAAMQTAHLGFQAAILAPTEILAKQHYDNFYSLLKDKNRIGLLTRNFCIADGATLKKPEFLDHLSKGDIDIVIGTHAVLQEKIQFSKLALVIIDEQHRFGVAQRSHLPTQGNKRPHLLSMSATPIPRTLALSLYGNLDVSTLSQVPSGRKPILTKIVTEAERDKAYQFVREQIASDRQAFIITPRVEDTDKSEVRSVKAEYARLSEKIFPNLKLGLVHGKMKGADKDKIMNAFNDGDLNILVATSVIEIGIDVPNSTVMIIEGAERFGLAQLHQLRGRVGRGQHQSYCFLFTTDDLHKDSERLNLFSKSNDGFALAQIDLEQRGFGDLFGKQQTGFVFRYPRFITIAALTTARDAAQLLLKDDPELKSHPKLLAEAEANLSEIHAE